MVETFKTRARFGWRVRNDAGQIEVSDPAVHASAADAMANAEKVMELLMDHFAVAVADGVFIDAGKVTP